MAMVDTVYRLKVVGLVQTSAATQRHAVFIA